MIGLVAALMLFFIVSDYISDYRAAYDEEYTSTTSVDGEEVVIEIPKNSPAKEVAQILYDNDLIKI